MKETKESKEKEEVYVWNDSDEEERKDWGS